MTTMRMKIILVYPHNKLIQLFERRSFNICRASQKIGVGQNYNNTDCPGGGITEFG